MRNLVSLCILVLVTSCVNKEKLTELPIRETASVKSIGTVGPSGEVILFAHVGNFIEVRECQNSSVLGSTSAEALSKCNTISTLKYLKSDFELALKYALVYGGISQLDHKSQSELNHYKAKGIGAEEFANYIRRLDEINSFIKAYGSVNANLAEKNELEKKINDNQSRIEAISRIDAMIVRSVQNILDQQKLQIISYSDVGGEILYNLLSYILKNPGPLVFKGKNKIFGERILTKIKEGALTCKKYDINLKGSSYLYEKCHVITDHNSWDSTAYEVSESSIDCEKAGGWGSSYGKYLSFLNLIQDLFINGNCILR